MEAGPAELESLRTGSTGRALEYRCYPPGERVTVMFQRSTKEGLRTMETIKVCGNRYGRALENFDFELDEDATEYRDTILECGAIFTAYYGAELIVWQLDKMVWSDEDAIADRVNLEAFAELPGAYLVTPDGPVTVTAGSVAHGKACELWEKILNESFILDEGRYYELLTERREQLAEEYVTDPTRLFGTEAGGILMTVLDLDQRLEVMVDLLEDEELNLIERVKGL